MRNGPCPAGLHTSMGATQTVADRRVPSQPGLDVESPVGVVMGSWWGFRYALDAVPEGPARWYHTTDRWLARIDDDCWSSRRPRSSSLAGRPMGCPTPNPL